MKLLDHSGEFKESVTMDVWSSEQHFGTGDEVALPENTSNNAKVTGSSRVSVESLHSVSYTHLTLPTKA